MLSNQYAECNKTNIKPIERDMINSHLDDIINFNKFNEVPLEKIDEILKQYNCELEFEGILCGREGRERFEITYKNKLLHSNYLIVSWYKHEVTNQYEIVTYLS